MGGYGGESDPLTKWRRLPSGLRHSLDWAGLFDASPKPASRKAKRHPDVAVDEAGEVADRERRRRAAQGARSTILTGALGPAASRRSVLSGY